MWKYIIIAALVLLAGAAFFFTQNNGALMAPDGEVAAFQTQFKNAVSKSREIETDKAIKKYSELRTARFNEQAEDYKNKTEAAVAETEAVQQEIMSLTTQLEAIRAAAKAASEEFNKFKNAALTAAEMDSSDISDEDDFRVAIITKLAEGAAANQTVADQITGEEAATAALNAEIKDTNEKIAAAKKLASDRMARLSPPELHCSVMTATPEWDFVILDAGINKGIISGSNLTVTRNGKKVGELLVTLVEGNRASCEVLQKTLRPGDRVQVGDTVTATRNDK